MQTGVDKLLREISSQDWWARQRAIAGLISRPEEEYLEVLRDGIRNHEDANIRNAAMEVFRALGQKAIPSLHTLAKDADNEVRLFTANILLEICDGAVFPVLSMLMNDTDVNVRVAAAEALGKVGGEAALGLLKKALEDEPWVAAAAINSLGDIGGQEALGILYDCLSRQDHRDMAIISIERAGNPESIRHLTSYIGYSGSVDPALKAVIRIAEREKLRPHPDYFISMVPMLIGMLASQNPELRRHAFMALSWSGDIAGLPYFIDAVKEEELQEFALEGLLKIGRKAVCGIVDELKASSGRHRAILVKVLEMIGENKALLQFAGDEDHEVRAEVALALGSLDMERAFTELRKMLSDPHDEVRHAAQRSMSKCAARKHEP